MTENLDPPGAQRAHLFEAGLLVVALFVGYEWLMSGLAKLVRGGFPSGLADELREKSEGISGWYQRFIEDTVIPNGASFGILIEVGELVIGVALIAAAATLLARRDLGMRGQSIAMVAIAAAAVGAIVMNVAFHLANGSAHPWLIPAEGFDEGVDLDSLMPLIELALLVVSIRWLRALRRAAPAPTAARAAPRPSLEGGTS